MTTTAATQVYAIRTDDGLMDDFEAAGLADALAQFEAPAHVRDAESFERWLNACGGYGWIEQDGLRIASVSA